MSDTVEFDNPTDWIMDHTHTHRDVSDSGFHLGFDEEGDPIITKNGESMCVNPEKLEEWLSAVEDYKEGLDE